MNTSELIEKFRLLKAETLKQESIKTKNSPYWTGEFSASDLPFIKAIYDNENNPNKEFTIYDYKPESWGYDSTMSYNEAIKSSDELYHHFMKTQWDNVSDQFISYAMNLMDVETLRPLHEKWSIGYHGLQSSILYSTDYLHQWLQDGIIDEELYVDILIATRHAILIHDVWKILHQDMPWSHNTLGLVVIHRHPELILPWMNERQRIIIEWAIEHHDIGWRMARGISYGEFNPCEDCAMVKICTKYRSAIDKPIAQKFIRSLPIQELSYEHKLDINMNIFKADVSSVRLLSWGSKSVPYIRALLLTTE